MLTAETLKSILDGKTTPLITPTRQLSRVRWTPCGTALLAAGKDGLLHRWNLEGEAPAELPTL
ncbi:MAG: hypothetical protein B7Z55_18400, partial [Planctomycetales bacterium 12-60-4]